MGLLNKLFRPDGKAGESVPASATRFQDTESGTDDEEAQARLTVRRELVQVTLRETMRRHAIPSDWLELRMLPVVTRKGRSGMHVQLVVRQGQSNLLGYIPAFQSSFMAEIEKFEPRAWDWLLSISWQFAAITATSSGDSPQSDWKVATAPAARPAPAAPAVPEPAADTEDDVTQDLQALFAIRDAALKKRPKDGPPDFEATRPGLPGDAGAGR